MTLAKMAGELFIQDPMSRSDHFTGLFILSRADHRFDLQQHVIRFDEA
jgi:hypothetical protein